MMDSAALRARLLETMKGSGFKDSPLKVIDINGGMIFNIRDVVFDAHAGGITYIKVEEEDG